MQQAAAKPLQVLARLSGTKGCKVLLCNVPSEVMCSRRVNARIHAPCGQQARSECPKSKASMTQLFIHDAMKTNHSKVADAVVMAFDVNVWACYCMSTPFFKHMVQLIAAAAPGFKLPPYAKWRGELLQRAPSVSPYGKPRRGGTCTKHALRRQVEADYACRGQGQPEAEDRHAHKCPKAGGRGTFTCMHV
eukprot:358344-Chlamydomonas_euryale.AAC.5